MNGVHDLGGMHGFGPVERAPGPPTVEPWEAAVIAIQGALRGAGVNNIDEFRHAIERMEPAHYLASSYFEHWLDGMERTLTEKGFITPAELDERQRHIASLEITTVTPGAPVRPPPPPDGPRYLRELDVPPAFAPGAAVLTRNFHPAGHTRLARYARGKRGVVHAYHGAYPFPDTSAHGLGEQPQHLYGVRFDSRELWGDSAGAGESVFIDLWQSYLLPA